MWQLYTAAMKGIRIHSFYSNISASSSLYLVRVRQTRSNVMKAAHAAS